MTRHDLTRPVELAVRGCCAAGVVLLVPDVVCLIVVLRNGVAAPGSVSLTAVMAVAGTAYFVFAQRLSGWHAWAAIAALAVTALIGLAVAAAVVLVAAALVLDFIGSPQVPVARVVVAFDAEAAVSVGVVWLLVQLWRSMWAIQRAAADGGHGFAVLPVAVVSVEPGDAP